MFSAPTFADTKELETQAFFRSAMLRWFWQLYTQRLTVSGRWFLWSSLLFASYGATSLESVQAFVPFSYALSFWVLAFFGALIFKPRLVLTTRHADRICAGEILQVDVEAEHRFGFAEKLWLSGMNFSVLPHRLPLAVDAQESPVALPAFVPGQAQKVRAKIGLFCKQRGMYRLKGYRVESDFPFGLLRSRRLFYEERTLLVYPQFRPLAQFQMPKGRRHHPGGVALISSLGDSLEYLGNREYREGDNFRNIDWRATARLNHPVVREYREEYFLRAAVILDTHVPAEKGNAKTFFRKSNFAAHKNKLRAAFERAVSVCASVSDYMARQDYLVDILAAGPNLYHLTAGRHLAYLDQILDILACVEENPLEPFDLLEPEIMENLSKINTVVCVFLDWNETRHAFVNNLREHGAGVRVIIVRDTLCTLDPVPDSAVLGHMPVITEEVYEAGIDEI